MLLSSAVSGCGAMLVVAQSQVLTGAGAASYVLTGRSLLDHAAGAVTKKDCHLIGGVVSDERKICEPRDSVHAHAGFKGLIGMLDKSSEDETPIDAPLGAPSLRLSSTMDRDEHQRQTYEDIRVVSSASNLTFSEGLASPDVIAGTGNPVTPDSVSVADTSLSSL